MTDNMLLRALHFATEAHEGQKRKYTGEPYVRHPIDVSWIMRDLPVTEEVHCAALLHDTIEDTYTTYDDIWGEFGERVAMLVAELTDVSKPEDGNRATRKAIDREHLAIASPEAQTIKLADIISNTSSIKEHDPKFWEVYQQEMKELLKVLTKGNKELHAIATELVYEE